MNKLVLTRSADENSVEDYRPHLEDITAIDVPPGFSPIFPKIAERLHNQWAARKFDEGWAYGETLDEEGKISPDLVPYDNLPDVEKEIYLMSAKQYVQFLFSIGVNVEPTFKIVAS
jgi:hypothetical protein